MTTTATEWSAKRILTEICDAEKRREIALAFWRGAEDAHRSVTIAQLAKRMHFREDTIRKSPAAKKADLLVTRVNSLEFEECFEAGLMVYHTTKASELLGAFLDAWNIPHVNGTIDAEQFDAPTREQVESALQTLRERFPLQDIALYLASAGLLMGGAWRESTWPVVDQLVSELPK